MDEPPKRIRNKRTAPIQNPSLTALPRGRFGITPLGREGRLVIDRETGQKYKMSLENYNAWRSDIEKGLYKNMEGVMEGLEWTSDVGLEQQRKTAQNNLEKMLQERYGKSEDPEVRNTIDEIMDEIREMPYDKFEAFYESRRKMIEQLSKYTEAQSFQQKAPAYFISKDFNAELESDIQDIYYIRDELKNFKRAYAQGYRPTAWSKYIHGISKSTILRE